MSDWLTPLQKITLVVLIAGAVGATIYTAVTDWAEDNKDNLTSPDFTSGAIVRHIDEVMV